MDDPLKPRAPGYGFGKDSRDNSLEKKKYTSPGPGQYQVKNYTGDEGKKLSFGGKYSEDHLLKESRNLPGPGAYNSLRTSL